MSAQLFEDGIRDLNRLVFAAEALEVPAPDDAWGDVENVVAELHAKAKAARAALIRMDIYAPPVPGSP
jgi:hypothetical protein